jgi:hypothetical protein
MEDPFAVRELRIRQPARMISGRARFDYFGPGRHRVASVVETDARSAMQMMGGLVPRTRVFEVRTRDGDPLLTLVKRDEDWLTDVLDVSGHLIGRIQTGETRRHYTLLDPAGQILGEAVGDLAVKKFAVHGPEGERLAQLRKTWAGIIKEMLTSADHYTVTYTGPMQPDLRTLIAIVPVILDLARHGAY